MNKHKITNALMPGVMLHGTSYNYRIERVLGQGSFGITYLASVKMIGALGSIDANLYVAIKEFFMREINGREDSAVTSGNKQGLYRDYQKKFVREAQNLAKLQHPHIIKVVESFEENNTVYYSMEYISGGSLDEMITENDGLSQSQVLEYTRQIGAALSFMHASGMLHLDLKPSNVMLKEGKVVLIDFGLSKQYDRNGEPESSTKVGGGTPGYAPIEQSNYRDGKGFPVTMDVYALGATMFKMLTGKRPPEASDILNEGFPVEELERHGARGHLRDVVRKAMSPLRKDRYQSIDELLADCGETDSEGTEVDVVAASQVNYGTYKKVVVEAEYGTRRIIEVPVKNPIRMPDSGIYIKLWKNDNRGVSKIVWLNERICNTVFTYLDGKKVCDEDFAGGIDEDVKSYLLKNGFLASEHWERQETTSSIDDDFGYEVVIDFAYEDGTNFVRRVAHAHPDFHALLLQAVEGLLRTTSLAGMVYSSTSEKAVTTKIKSSQRNVSSSESFDTKEEEIKMVIRPDTSAIVIDYQPQSPYWKGAYSVNITRSAISIYTNLERNFPFSEKQFRKVITDLKRGNFRVRKTEVPFIQWEYSESPTSITISLLTEDGCYAKYWLKSIARHNYGNLVGDADELNEYIQSIVPGLKEYLEEEDAEYSQPPLSPQPEDPPTVRYNWWAPLLILFLGIFFMANISPYCLQGHIDYYDVNSGSLRNSYEVMSRPQGRIDYHDLDGDGAFLAWAYGVLLLVVAGYLWKQRNDILPTRWKLMRNITLILFVANTSMLVIWNHSLTFAYLVLSCGLLLITSFMFAFNRK